MTEATDLSKEETRPVPTAEPAESSTRQLSRVLGAAKDVVSARLAGKKLPKDARGLGTTEFWAMISGLLAGTSVKTGALGTGSVWETIAGLALDAISIGFYIWSRTRVKATN